MRWLRFSLLVLIPGLFLGAAHASTLIPQGDGYLQQSAASTASCQSQTNADDSDVAIIVSRQATVALPDCLVAAPCASADAPIYSTSQARAPPIFL
ncbi:hypothetical protein C9927_02140 [Pseudidiomarina aestuarii]|uniref:Uncharacterized protein n=1 Tax=Pseudidiomarina aestuarii TaxID=624146 RepID=A0A2T4CVU2_9GAMM|nr:hypothetical protein C9986_02595 [Pseudidiomarina aestuarii]PTB85628.1 hypothetical protein C9988_00095 [Pseudidiomarina aestuarii]PTB89297.1 hypothetical protein C9927_02140 [Pseudidiomarina aestuarii]